MFAVEGLDVFKLRSADELAFQIVSPAVIAAAKEFARSAAFSRRSSAMTADIIEAAQLAFGVTNQKQRFALQFGGKEIAGMDRLACPTSCQQRLNIFSRSSEKTSASKYKWEGSDHALAKSAAMFISRCIRP